MRGEPKTKDHHGLRIENGLEGLDICVRADATELGIEEATNVMSGQKVKLTLSKDTHAHWVEYVTETESSILTHTSSAIRASV